MSAKATASGASQASGFGTDQAPVFECFGRYHDHWSTDHLDTRALPPLPSECRRSRHHMGDKAKRGRPPVATPPIHSNHSIGILDRREMAASCHPLVPGSSVWTPTPSGRPEERGGGKECVSRCRSRGE